MTTLIPLDEALGATLDAVSAAINERALDETGTAVNRIADISSGTISATLEQRAAMSDKSVAALRADYVQRVEDLSRAFVTGIGKSATW